MHLLHPLPLCDATVIPRSFELFYTATVARTLAIALRMTAERETAHRVTQNAYTVMLTQWCERQSQPLPANARHLIALATRIAARSCLQHDGSASSARTVGPPEQQRDDEFELFWFDLRDGMRELAVNAHVPWPRRPEAPFSALVADGDQWSREAVTAWLVRIGAATVHEAGTVAEAREHALARGSHDLAILDLELPGGSGIELVTQLRSRGWCRIVVLASPDHWHTVPLAFRAGAQACLLKTAYLSDNSRLVSGGVADTQYNLSTQDVKVLQLVAAGHSNKEIGRTLHRSSATIKNQLSRIGYKLGTGNRARMVVHAMRASIIR